MQKWQFYLYSLVAHPRLHIYVYTASRRNVIVYYKRIKGNFINKHNFKHINSTLPSWLPFLILRNFTCTYDNIDITSNKNVFHALSVTISVQLLLLFHRMEKKWRKQSNVTRRFVSVASLVYKLSGSAVKCHGTRQLVRTGHETVVYEAIVYLKNIDILLLVTVWRRTYYCLKAFADPVYSSWYYKAALAIKISRFNMLEQKRRGSWLLLVWF